MIVELKGEETSWPKLVFLGVLSRFWTLTVVFAIVVLLGLWANLLPPLPRWAEVGAVASIPGILIGWAAGVKVDSATEPQYHYLIDVALPGEAGDDGAMYELAEEDFRELEVLEDDLEHWSSHLHVGKGVRIDDLVVEEGTWMGGLSDRELLTARSQLKVLRGQLEEDAKKGFVLENNAFVIIRGATQSAVRQIVETFEKGTLPDDGNGISKRVEDALEDFDLGSKLKDREDDPFEQFDFDAEDVIDDDREVSDDLGLPSPDGGDADDD